MTSASLSATRGELFHQLVTNPTDEGSPPSRLALIAHGIFGRGQNWRTLARGLATRCPDLGVVLLDLRAHGKSLNLRRPHSLAAAATDVVETASRLASQEAPVCALIGHSFGGKVMLAASLELDLDRLWIIDSSPSADPAAMSDPTAVAPSALTMLDEVTQGVAGFAERGDFIDALKERGVAAGVAQFLAMNLQRSSDGFELAINLEDIRSLLTDYFERDLWSAIDARGHNGRTAIDVAVAERGSALSAADIARFENSAAVTVHHVADSGHWIHADQPAALLDLLAASLKN